MSEVVEINDLAELQKVIDENVDVVVDFAAPAWCGPCRQFAPHFDKASEKSTALFVAVDIDKAPEAATEFDIMSVPTVIQFKYGERKTIKSRTVLPLLDELQ